MNLKNKKAEYFMFDLSDAEWSDETTSSYWKDIEKQVLRALCMDYSENVQANWTVDDTKLLYPTLTDKEAYEAWELGW